MTSGSEELVPRICILWVTTDDMANANRVAEAIDVRYKSFLRVYAVDRLVTKYAGKKQASKEI